MSVIAQAAAPSGGTAASRCAFGGAALFVAASHLVLFPVVAVLPAPPWARAAGYSWPAFDAILNIALINGAHPATVNALRLGGR